MKKNESEVNVLVEEIAAHEYHDDIITHKCTIDGNKHGPLPVVKGSYGMCNKFV